MGVSGSGKSTLLYILSTLLAPNSGEVIFEGNDIYAQGADELLRIRREEFGIIFQSHYLFRGFSAKENLEVASILGNQAIDVALLKRFGIESLLHQQVGSLSGGQQQRFSIARVLTKKPKIIFADEPTGNLDKESAKKVMDELMNYVNENDAALIVTTHDKTIADICNRRFQLKDKGLWSY